MKRSFLAVAAVLVSCPVSFALPSVNVTSLGEISGGDAFLLSVDPADEAGNYNLVTPIITGSFVNADASGFTAIPGGTDTGFNQLFPTPTFIGGFGFAFLGLFDTPTLLEASFSTLNAQNTISSLGVLDFAIVILESGTSADFSFEFLATGIDVGTVTGTFGASAPVIPEPGMLAVFGGLFATVCGVRRRA